MRTFYFPGGMVALLFLLLGLSHSLQLASAGSPDSSETSMHAVRKLLQSSSNVPASATPTSVFTRRGFPVVQHLVSLAIGVVIIGAVAITMYICCRRPRRRPAPAAASQSPQVVLLRFGPQSGDVWRQESGLPPGLVTTFPTKEFKKASSSSADRECAVCLSEYEDGDLLRELPGCGHSFHSTCIDTWLHKHGTCPICRMRQTAPNNSDSLETTHEHPGDGAGDGADPLGGVGASRRVLFEALENYRAELARVEAEAAEHLAAAHAAEGARSSRELERDTDSREGVPGSGNGGEREEATVVEMGQKSTEESSTSRDSRVSEGPKAEQIRW